MCGSYKPCGPKGRIQHAISQCLHSLDSQQIFFFQFCGVYLFLKRNWICTGHMSKKHMAVAHANHHSGINHMNYVHSSPPCKDGFLPAAFVFIGQRSWSLRKPRNLLAYPCSTGTAGLNGDFLSSARVFDGEHAEQKHPWRFLWSHTGLEGTQSL